MIDMVTAAAGAGLLLTAVLGFGSVCARALPALKPLPYRFAAGAYATGMAVYLLAWAGVLSWWTHAALVVSGTALFIALGELGRLKARIAEFPAAECVVFAAVAGLLLLRAFAPVTIAFDPLIYQLGLPKLTLITGHLPDNHTIWFSYMPALASMHYLLLENLTGSGAAAQLFAVCVTLVTATAIADWCSDHLPGRVSSFAALVWLASPAVNWFGAYAYADNLTALYGVIALRELTRKDGNWIVAGLMLGAAAACKQHGLLLAPLAAFAAAAAILLRGADVGEVKSRVALIPLLIVLLPAPFYLRAIIETGNPIWPIANELFGLPSLWPPGRNIVAESAGGSGYGLALFLRLKNMVLMTLKPLQMQRALTPILLVGIPAFAWHVWKWRTPPMLLLAAVLSVAVVFFEFAFGQVPRYFGAGFGLAAVAAVIGIHHWRRTISPLPRRLLSVGLVCAVAAGFTGSLEDIDRKLPVLTGRQTVGEFLRAGDPAQEVIDYANRELPPDSRLLLSGFNRGYHLDFDYDWDYYVQWELRYSRFDDPALFAAKLHERGITHVIRHMELSAFMKRAGFEDFSSPWHRSFREQFLRETYSAGGYTLYELLPAFVEKQPQGAAIKRES